MSSAFSWVIAAIGVTGMAVAGRRRWWGWAINLGNEALWIIYAIRTQQYGFVAMALAYGTVYARNLRAWRSSDTLP